MLKTPKTHETQIWFESNHAGLLKLFRIGTPNQIDAASGIQIRTLLSDFSDAELGE